MNSAAVEWEVTVSVIIHSFVQFDTFQQSDGAFLCFDIFPLLIIC